jgi:response regulator RpfG family c-di-GMP phosphodiesterase
MTEQNLQMRNDTVRSLVRALETHGPGEGAHADRVAVYATATGGALGLSLDDLVCLRWAAALHDVGKISVDPQLLKKLGKLTEAELAQLRSHAELAMRVIEEFEWLKPVVPMVRHHHERFDGTGYPDGLSGDSIPLGARIIAVAETFDVLTQHTPWRDPMPCAEALDELERCSGEQFDPSVVEAFLKVQPLIQPVGQGA